MTAKYKEDEKEDFFFFIFLLKYRPTLLHIHTLLCSYNIYTIIF